jgi:hypothetical protein
MIINGKNYRIPEINFGAVRKLSNYGVSLYDLKPKRDFMNIINAFTCLAADIEPEDADYLIEQHILGGGTMDGWIEEILKAVETSPFLQKIAKQSQKKERRQPQKQTQELNDEE